MVPRRRPRRAGCEPHLPPEHRSRSASACAKPRSLPPPRSGRGGRALRCVLSQARDEARTTKLSVSAARPASAPCSRSGASACLATELCRKWSAAVVTWAQPRNEKRSAMDVPAQVVESGPNAATSPAMVAVARPVNACSPGWAAARTSGEQDASAIADVTMTDAAQGEPRQRRAVHTPTARLENIRAVRTGSLQPRRSSVVAGPTRAL